eukprot:TRINITY_DN8906_c0_g1_i1.p1 TRINITY_DN8906_c0_g1~~TRINITY_DN8906_c0_g1_i1.p1  ORF type:complete len:122 (+),score=14.16 TRINITY_DN8906_c0_g1_i1:186-551(+)
MISNVNLLTARARLHHPSGVNLGTSLSVLLVQHEHATHNATVLALNNTLEKSTAELGNTTATLKQANNKNERLTAACDRAEARLARAEAEIQALKGRLENIAQIAQPAQPVPVGHGQAQPA